MIAPASSSEIYNELQKAFEVLEQSCESVPDNSFFEQPGNGWSKAQHLRHLTISTQTSTAAYALPLFLVRVVGGKPKRPSMDYTTLVDTYLKRLNEGGKATGRYIPSETPAHIGKEKMLHKWKTVTAAFLKSFESIKEDSLLDKYQVSHPLLGKITLRELSFFTIYHTYHHHKAIVQ